MPRTPETLNERLDHWVAAQPESLALRFGESVYSYADVGRSVARIASGLVDLGVRPGHRVAVKLANCAEFFLCTVAIWRIGAAHVTIHALFRDEETEHVLRDCGARVLITSEQEAETLARIAGGLPALERVVVVESSPQWSDGISLEEVRARGRNDFPEHQCSADALATIAYTSGTSGQPKGAMMGHENLIDFWEQAAGFFGLTSESHVAQVLPVFYLNTSPAGVWLAWWLGAQATLLERFTAQAFACVLEEHRIAYVTCVPTMLADVANLETAREPDLSSLRYVLYGGAPTPASVRTAIEQRFQISMIQAYGMTEAGLIAMEPLDDSPPPGAVGRPVEHTQVSILDQRNQPLPIGDVGEICLRPAREPDPRGRVFHPIQGYWNSPELTAEALAGDYFHTGDLGRLDGDGFLYVVDRKKDMIIRGGNNIYPAELEQVLRKDPRVLEAIVLAAPNDRLGEVPKAFVVLAPGACSEDRESILITANRRMMALKRIEEIEIIAAQDVPRNAMGKVLKRTLAQRMGA